MRSALALVTVLLVAGCLEQPPGGRPEGDGGSSVTFRTLASDGDSGIRTPERTVLPTQEAYDAAWARHASGPNPKGAPPPVDFARERVVLVALGEKGSGCHAISVENVSRNGEAIAVHVLVVAPGPEVACPAVMVQPVHFVAVASTSGAIEFRERTLGAGERPPPPTTDPDVERLSVRELARGSFSGIHEDTRVVLRGLQEWHDLWQRHDDVSAPGVSFPNESVAAVVEHGPTGCFGIHVGNVTYDPAARVLTVEVVHERTPPHVQCIQAIQDAYHFVAIPDRPGETRFIDLEEDSAGAASPPSPTPGTGSLGRGHLERRTLAAGGASGVEEVDRRVIADATTWASYWAAHASPMDPPREVPAVDFDQERVFVATLGAKPDACWAVRVTAIEETSTSLRVEVTTYPPPSGMACAQAVSHPHHFVAFPASDRPLVVEERAGVAPPPDV